MGNTDDLADGVRFELVFLQEVYRISAWDMSPVDMPDLVMYYDGSGCPCFEICGRGIADFSDWRPGFMAVGKPLVFITAFKVMDILVSWVIERATGRLAPFKTEEKYKRMSALSLNDLPAVFSDNSWLLERFLSMYQRLVDVRNTLIHRGEFEVGPEVMRVKAGRSTEANWVCVKDQQLRDISAFLLNVVWGCAGLIQTDYRWSRLVRLLCDRLSDFHACNQFGQRELVLGVFRIKNDTLEDIRFDLSAVKLDMDRRCSVGDRGVVADTIFDLEVNVLGPMPRRFVVPWDALQDFSSGITASELLGFEVV